MTWGIRPAWPKTKTLAALTAGLLAIIVVLLGYIDIANAATGTWKDSATIIYNGREFKATDNSRLTFKEGGNAVRTTCSLIKFTSEPSPSTSNTGVLHEIKPGGPAGCALQGETENFTIAADSDTATGDPGLPGGSGNNEPPEPTCDAGGWSWMICPLITATGQVMEWVSDFISSMSFFAPLPIGQPQDTAEWAIFRAWSTFLTYANIAAVIGFLYIIFSQATSIGISSYGIKKLLPKVIAALILMNLSYYICALLVDLSNVAGVGITNLFSNILSTVRVEGDADLYDGGWSDDMLGKVIGMGSIGLIIILGGFMIPLLIAALAVFFTLAARIAIIVLLVIVSPLAFAAWILPNTEKYFSKWWQTFISMLVLYPLLMAIMGGATLASRILLEVSQDSESTIDNVMPFIALLVQALPLLALPAIIRGAGGAMAKLQNMSQRASQGTTNFAKDKYEKSALGRERAVRKQNKDMIRQERWLKGEGIGGKAALMRRRAGMKGVSLAQKLPGVNMPVASQASLRMAEQIEKQQGKLEAERIEDTFRNMSGNVATGISEGLTVSEMIKRGRAGDKKYSSAQDMRSLDYLERSGFGDMDGKKGRTSSVFATAAMQRVMDIENIDAKSNDGNAEAQVQNLAKLVGTDTRDNARFTERLAEAASKHGYKNLAYGTVTDGVFQNYTVANKTPEKLVTGGLNGINKDMLDDSKIQAAIQAHINSIPRLDANGDVMKDANGETIRIEREEADKNATRLEVIRQTTHINKQESIATLAKQIGMSFDDVMKVRQSIQAGGAYPMPEGFIVNQGPAQTKVNTENPQTGQPSGSQTPPHTPGQAGGYRGSVGDSGLWTPDDRDRR